MYCRSSHKRPHTPIRLSLVLVYWPGLPGVIAVEEIAAFPHQHQQRERAGQAGEEPRQRIVTCLPNARLEASCLARLLKSCPVFGASMS